MYSVVGRGQQRTGLTADEVNMVKMAQTGQDRTAGTGDDYSITLEYVEDCASADSKVRFLNLGPTGPLGGCAGTVDYSFSQSPILAQNYSMVPTPGGPDLDITLNDFFEWKTYEEAFSDGFESGDTASWSVTFP